VRELKDLEEKFNYISLQSQAALSSYLAEALPNVRSAIITKGAFYNIRPFEIERAGFKRGRQLKKMPTSINNTHVYHLDESDRIVFVEIYGQSENIVNREFYSYSDDCIERAYFTSIGRLRNISISLLEHDLVRKDLNWGEYGCSISDYKYSDGRLDKISVHQKEHMDASFAEFEVYFEYSEEGLIKIVNVFPNGYQEQRYP